MGSVAFTATAGRSALRTALASPALLAFLAGVALVLARHLANPLAIAATLGDTDDAARLVQLRAFLEHGRWLDLTLAQIGAPEALVSHWSRLIDLGLATVLASARLLTDGAGAETAMRILWPALMLGGLLAVSARETARDGGATAGWALVGLAALSTTAIYQFQPGRIDHHNVQILCAVGGVLLLARSLSEPRTGWAAGGLIGLGLAIGLEAATLVVPALAAAVIAGLGRRQGLDGVARAAVGMAATLGTAVLATTAPSRLGVMACDAAAFNLVALSAAAAAGVVMAALSAQRESGPRLVWRQVGALSATGLAGLAAYGLLEPACLAGPFGQVEPGVWPVWLSRVTEVQPITFLLATVPRDTLGFLATTAAGIVARAVLARRAASRDPTAAQREAYLLGVQIIALAAALWQAKMTPYAAWLALPALARMVAALPAIGGGGAATVRLGAFLAVNQTTLGAVGGAALALLPQSATVPEPLRRTSCSDTATISALAELPTGLVLADVNLGPYVAALTPHRVVMAPYHRIGRSIVEGHALLSSPPAQAESGLRRLGVTYVVSCAATADAGGAAPERATLDETIAAGGRVTYLEPMALSGAPALRVQRMRP